MALNEKLKTLREEYDLTQDYVATQLHVARSTVSGYETKNRQPSHEKLTALANLFHVSVDYLLDDNEIQIEPSRVSNYTTDEQSLISKYRNLSLPYKKRLMEEIRLYELAEKASTKSKP